MILYLDNPREMDALPWNARGAAIGILCGLKSDSNLSSPSVCFASPNQFARSGGIYVTIAE